MTGRRGTTQIYIFTVFLNLSFAEQHIATKVFFPINGFCMVSCGLEAKKVPLIEGIVIPLKYIEYYWP
jgi:hypothetical protein